MKNLYILASILMLSFQTYSQCSRMAIKYKLDTIRNTPSWSSVDLALPAGATLDSIYGGFARPGYTGATLSYTAWSVGTTNNVSLLNTTTSFYGTYTGQYNAWINTTSYNVVGQTGSYIRFSITTSNGMVMDSAIIAYSFPTPATPTITQSLNTLTSSTSTSYQWYFNGNILNGRTNDTINASMSGQYSVQITNSNGCTAMSAPFTFVYTGRCSQVIVKYQLDTVRNTPLWSSVDLMLPAGAQLDSIYGGFQRPGYSGATLSYTCWSVGTTNDTSLLNKTTSFYGNYTGPYNAWINTDSYKVIGKTGSYVRFSITTSNGMQMDSALIAWSFSKPTATITPSATSVCQGNDITLTVNTGTGLTYSWSTTETANPISVSATGNYTLTVTNSNNCTNTASQAVTVNPLPPTPIITQGAGFLSSSSATGNQWFYNGNIMAGRVSDTLNLGSSGNYSVEVTNSNSCTATSPPFSYSATCKADITTGLVARYDFLGNANDLSGNNNNGTVDGATLTTDRFGNPNSAYSFNGTSSYIDVPNSSTLTFPNNAMSVSMWINANSMAKGGNDNIIISKQSGSGTSQSGFNVYDDNVYNATGLLVSSGGGIFGGTQDTNVALSKFYHLVFTYNNGVATCYKNNVLEENISGQSGTIGANTEDMLIGMANWSNANASPFNGVLDDIRIYNRALQPCDVDSLYNLTDPITTGISSLSVGKGIKVFPNPASGQTTIKYELASNSPVVIELYDLLGNKVNSILNTNQQSGSYQLTIDMGDLNSGIYLLKSSLNGTTYTERIVLMK